MAVKATWAQVAGEERLLFKDPKTDDGTKKSQRGRVVVYKGSDGELHYLDGLTKEGEKAFAIQEYNLLETVFKNGVLIKDQSLDEIRERLLNN